MRPVSHGIARFAQTLLVAAMLALIWSGEARAHGDASWIMRHPSYGWCCGPQDCFSLDRAEVRIERDHYVADRLALRWPIVGTYRSEDDRYWVCYFMRGSRFEQVKCFFAPRPPAM